MKALYGPRKILLGKKKMPIYRTYLQYVKSEAQNTDSFLKSLG